MRRTISRFPVALTVLTALGCGGARTPSASPPEARPPGPPIEAIDPPRQNQGEVMVMAKKGPETITITETVDSDTEKLPRYAEDNNSRFLRADSTPEGLKSRPKQKE